MKKVFAAVDDTGGLIGVSGSLDGAASEAKSFGAKSIMLDETLSGAHAEAQSNPPLTPERAHALMGSLYIDYDEATSMSLEEAVERCLRYLPSEKVQMGTTRGLRVDKAAIIDRVLSQNYKTSKTGEIEKIGFEVDVQGVNMLPHTIWWDSLGAVQHKPVRVPVLGSNGKIVQKEVKHLTTCAGASKDCKASCLVYSGQNVMDIYATIYKLAWTNCLIFESTAYMRLLSQAVHRHLGSARKRQKGVERFVRLNVLSDVPWELVCPGLIESMSDYTERKFSPIYDYTKVPGRRTGDFYDLTFSFSGSNAKDCVRESEEANRRIAVVFIDHLTGKRKPEKLPSHVSFVGGRPIPVIDGDEHDARAIDKDGVVVGLKYKAPRTPGTSYHAGVPKELEQRLERTYGDYYKRIVGTPQHFTKHWGKSEEKVSAFLVPAYETREGALVTAVVPRQQPDFDPDADSAPRGESSPGERELSEYLDEHAPREVVS